MMRNTLTVVVCAAAFTGFAGTAQADGPRIVSGGPNARAARARIVSSIARADAALSVCWLGKRATAVKIQLRVDGRGRVTSASHKDGGRVGQCAAGVLAVRKVAGVGSGYTVVVSIPTRAAGARTSASIDASLARYQSKLQDCYKRARKKRPGSVEMSFFIRPDGTIGDPRIAATTIKSSEAERCIVSVLGAMSLGPASGRKTIAYSLQMAFGGSANTTPSANDPKLRPMKDGPVSTADLNRVMRAKRSKFSACYERVARKKPKLAGTVLIRFTIRDNGTVRNVKIRETTLHNATVEACIVKVGKTLVFPSELGRAKTRVFYPFRFSRRQR